MVLAEFGNPVAREGDEVNPYIFHSLIEACKFAEEELKNHDGISIVEIRVLETKGSGK